MRWVLSLLQPIQPDMKFIRNLAIYYIVLGALCGLTFAFFGFFWIGVVGLILLAGYYLSKYLFKVDVLLPSLPAGLKKFIAILLIALPFITIAGIEFYYHRPFKQIILLPNDYQGLVVVAYDEANAGNNTWQDGYRLLKVDKQGVAKTSFTMPKHIVATLDETHISYAGNPGNSFPIAYHAPANGQKQITAYMVDFTDNYQIYVITNNFDQYFLPNSSNELKPEAEKKLAALMNAANLH